jgi:hypothetical protein
MTSGWLYLRPFDCIGLGDHLTNLPLKKRLVVASETEDSFVVRSHLDPLDLGRVACEVDADMLFYRISVPPYINVCVFIPCDYDVRIVTKTYRNEARSLRLGVQRVPADPVGPQVVSQVLRAEEKLEGGWVQKKQFALVCADHYLLAIFAKID